MKQKNNIILSIFDLGSSQCGGDGFNNYPEVAFIL